YKPRVANTKESQPPHARHHPQQSIAASAVGCMPCSNGRAHPRPITDSAEAVRCSARLDSLPSSQRQPCVPLAENPCGSDCGLVQIAPTTWMAAFSYCPGIPSLKARASVTRLTRTLDHVRLQVKVPRLPSLTRLKAPAVIRRSTLATKRRELEPNVNGAV